WCSESSVEIASASSRQTDCELAPVVSRSAGRSELGNLWPHLALPGVCALAGRRVPIHELRLYLGACGGATAELTGCERLCELRIGNGQVEPLQLGMADHHAACLMRPEDAAGCGKQHAAAPGFGVDERLQVHAVCSGVAVGVIRAPRHAVDGAVGQQL